MSSVVDKMVLPSTGGNGKSPEVNATALRDAIALKAMEAILLSEKSCSATWDVKEVANTSYMLADAMLAARAK